jgi:hypothetical protein
MQTFGYLVASEIISPTQGEPPLAGLRICLHETKRREGETLR